MNLPRIVVAPDAPSGSFVGYVVLGDKISTIVLSKAEMEGTSQEDIHNLLVSRINTALRTMEKELP